MRKQDNKMSPKASISFKTDSWDIEGDGIKNQTPQSYKITKEDTKKPNQ